MEREKHSKKPIGKIIGFSILGVIGAWLLLTVVVPLAMGDGVNNFTGTEKGVAEAFSDYSYGTVTTEDLTPEFMIRFHIDDVHPTTPEEIAQYCHDPNLVTNDPTKYTYYTVVSSVRRLGNFGAYQTVSPGCQFSANVNRYFKQD